MVRALAGDRRRREFNSRPFRCQVTTLGKLFTHMCLCHRAVWFRTSRGAAMSCDWEGNRKSGVTLAMHYKWFIDLRAHGLSKGDEHPTNTPHGVWYSLSLPCTSWMNWRWRLFSLFLPTQSKKNVFVITIVTVVNYIVCTVHDIMRLSTIRRWRCNWNLTMLQLFQFFY